jgi:hypothetical protein
VGKREPVEINYAYQNSVSYSQYSMFSECQYRWYLNYVKKIKERQPGVALIFGTSFHEVLQEYLRVLFDCSVKEANELDLASMLRDRIRENYVESVKENGDRHFSTSEELKEHYLDGLAILEWIKKNRQRYFNTKTMKLIGIEVPILLPVSDNTPNVFINGYIDLIIYNINSDTYTVYDIKTSTWGWKDKDKKNQTKINQVLFYKKYFSEKMSVPEENIDVQFFICKRKVYENSDFPIYRVQEFSPAQGKRKVNEAIESLKSFVSHSFDDRAKHKKDAVYSKNTLSCKYCEFNNKPDLCDKKTSG